MLRPFSLAPLAAAFLLLLVFAMPAWADELIVDNGDSSVLIKGNWSATTTTSGFYGGNYLFRTSGDGTSSVTWRFPGSAAAGRYEVFARWSSGSNRATNATYQVSSQAGNTGVSTNQQQNGGSWQSLGTFDFAPGQGQGVTLTDRANGVVVADAVRWVGPSAAPTSGTQTQAFMAVAATPAATPSPTVAPAAPQPPAPAPPPSPSPAPNDPRYFAQTGYRVDQDAFWDYFQHRGGVRTFGYPSSNTFTLLGYKVQVFQRQVMQLRPDGGVQTLNLLDEGLMPYTKINGSTFPAPDSDVVKRSPSPSDPDYLDKALQFVRDNAPDNFDGQPVGFSRTFFSTVKPEDAFPGGVPDGVEGILPGFNLELWGLPTSKPTYDPSNRNFSYQRFQRGIMHYDKTCGCTQGLLLGDYFKAILTGRNVPDDLAAQAKGGRFFAQFASNQPQGLARPNDLPGSNFQNAFRRNPSITIDAGHGGAEIGTSHTFPDGTVLQEKNLNLRVATRVRDLLQQAGGFDVTITRTKDVGVNVDKKDLTGDGKVGLSDDLQARIDTANNAHSDIFVSIHFNGISDTSMKGTYTFYDPNRPFADRSKALAQFVLTAIEKSMKDAGYTPVDHGATDDTKVLGGGHYYLLGPQSDIIARPSNMPAMIGEALFLTNDDDANAARNDKIVEAIAQGYVVGIKAYFAQYPPS